MNFSQLTDIEQRNALKWLDVMNLSKTLDSNGNYIRLKQLIYTIPSSYLNEKTHDVYLSDSRQYETVNYYDKIINDLWDYIDVNNGSFSRLNSSNNPATRDKYMKHLSEITNILDEKGVRPSCFTGYGERYKFLRSLEKTAGQAAKFFQICAQDSAGKTIAESPLMRSFLNRPGGFLDKMRNPGQEYLKRKFTEEIEPMNKRFRTEGGGKTLVRRRKKNHKKVEATVETEVAIFVSSQMMGIASENHTIDNFYQPEHQPSRFIMSSLTLSRVSNSTIRRDNILFCARVLSSMFVVSSISFLRS